MGVSNKPPVFSSSLTEIVYESIPSVDEKETLQKAEETEIQQKFDVQNYFFFSLTFSSCQLDHERMVKTDLFALRDHFQ